MSKNSYQKVVFAPDIENFTANSYQTNGPQGLPLTSDESKASKYSIKYIRANVFSKFPPSVVKSIDFSVVPRKNLRFWCGILIVLSLHSLYCDYWDVNG